MGHMGEADDERFDEWNELKKKLNHSGGRPTIREGEIWWYAAGANIGIEIDGKGKRFSRPILIMTKLSKDGFMGIPLTSQEKSGSWYVSFDFLEKTQYAAVCQAKVMSVSRLYTKIGQVPKSDLERVRTAFHKIY